MYGSLAEAETYHANRNRSEWAAADPQEQTAALEMASTYLDSLYEPRYVGERAGGVEQSLGWPRVGQRVTALGLSDETVPLLIQSASYELAYYELTNPGSLFRVFDPTTAVKRETVGPITTEYALPNSESPASAFQVKIGFVEGMIEPLLKSSIKIPVAFVV